MPRSKYKHTPIMRFVTKAAVCVATILIPVVAMAAQFTATPTELSLSGVNVTAQYAYSVALSANGQVALVGGQGGTPSGPSTDAAYVYMRTSGGWGNPVELSQTGISNNNNLGFSVALSANGQVALVGEWATNSAYVYRESNGTWSTPVKLSMSGITPTEFGYSVALSPDGKTAIVGDNGYNSNAGAAYVYTYNGTTWSTGTSLTPSGLSNAQYGFSIALSSNGSTGLVALIGAVQAGKAYVSTYNGSSWSIPAALSTSGISGAGSYGYSVSLSANGQAAIVGSAFTDAAYVYTEANGTWNSPKTLTTPSGANSFGYAVAMAPSGEEVFVSDVFANSNQTGGVYAYTYNGSSWSAPMELPSTGLQPQSGTGWSLAQGADGQILLVGSPFANGNTGAPYIYESPTPVTLSVTPNPTSVAPGNSVTLDLTFTNADTASGGLPAVSLTDVTLTDTLPAGATYVSSNAANGSCSHTSTVVTCTLATLAAGTNNQNPWQPSITVTTPASASILTNTVSFTADEPLTGTSTKNTPITNDIAPTVTSGSLSTAVSTAVSGTLSATPGYTGQPLTFTIVTQPNHGTVNLSNAGTGAFTYTPNSGYTGADSFVFTAGDGIVVSAPGSEAIAVGSSGSGGSSGGGSKSGGGAVGMPLLFVLAFLVFIRSKYDRPAVRS